MLTYKNIIKYTSISNEDAVKGSQMSDSEKEQFVKSDLISGVYEGGLKVWECTFDMVDYLETTQMDGKSVIELGCGQGLPGILCAKKGASKVVLQDYNEHVIEKATKITAAANLS